jgi:hypothetical protein
MKAKVLLQWALFLLAQTIIFFLFLSLFLSPAKPVSLSEIPQETKDYISDLISKLDVDIKFVDFFDEEDWLNEGDFGQDSLAGLAHIQDSNFIVYYDSTLNGEAEYAKFTIENAGNNIHPLSNMFGGYFYPEHVNGRKLALYLANSNERFSEVFTKLTGRTTNTEWMAGVCITTISGSGQVYTDGIILKTYDQSRKPERFISNLKHEMAHYVHLNSVDWLSNYPKVWETEGFAMYFEGNLADLAAYRSYADKSLNNISLTADVDNYTDSYWVGYTVMLCLEKDFGKQAAIKYIRNNYTHNYDQNILTQTLQNPRAFESRWRRFVEGYY